MEWIRPELLKISPGQINALVPYLTLFGSSCVAILASVLPSKWRPTYLVALLVGFGFLGSALASLSLAAFPSTSLFGGMMVSDPFGHFLNVLYCLLGGVVLLSSYEYLDRQHLRFSEFEILLSLSVLGMGLLTATQHLIVLFLALELMSLSVYVLVGFRRSDRDSNEAALKYYILGSAASAVLLYGMALLYGATGSFHLTTILSRVLGNLSLATPAFLLGTTLLVTGFLFKVAAVPFHMWMPDVYQGAPLPVTSFMTGALKLAVFGAFVRVLLGLDFGGIGFFSLGHSLYTVLWVVAALTMLIGNLVALLQRNLKRMLAYSSIAHTGYLLVGILAGCVNRDNFAGVIYYLVVYALMNVGAFTALGLLVGPRDTGIELENLGGLATQKRWIAVALGVFLFSMAGIPPTGGFFSKYVLFYSGVQSGAVGLVVLGVLCSAISVYYYLRVIVYMFMRPAASSVGYTTVLSPGSYVALAFTAAAVLLLGILPGPLLDVARSLLE